MEHGEIFLGASRAGNLEGLVHRDRVSQLGQLSMLAPGSLGPEKAHQLQTHLQVPGFTWEAEVRALNTLSKSCEGRAGVVGIPAFAPFISVGSPDFPGPRLGFIKAI